MARDHGCYIIRHNGICATISQGLLDTNHQGKLSDVGFSMFLVDIVLLIKHVRNPFQVAQEAKAMSFKMLEAIKMCNMDAVVHYLHLND